MDEFILRTHGEVKRFSGLSWSEHPFVVYLAVNVQNNKLYVGATQKGMRARKLIHFYNANKGRQGKFYNAIRKHGRYAFKFIVLRECSDFFDALAQERILIKELKPEYNLTEGGGGVKGYKMSDASKAKMRAAKLGKPGRPCPEWLKKKNADLRRLDRGKPKPNNRQPVACLNDGREFSSVKEAAAFYRITSAMISASCTKGRRRGGYLFKRLSKDSSYV